MSRLGIRKKIPRSFAAEETSLGYGGFPRVSFQQMSHVCPALITVFSSTQSGHLDITHYGFLQRLEGMVHNAG